MIAETIDRINELERLEATATLAALARDLAIDRAAFVAGAHQVVTRGHAYQCSVRRTWMVAEDRCDCGFDKLRGALKEVAP